MELQSPRYQSGARQIRAHGGLFPGIPQGSGHPHGFQLGTGRWRQKNKRLLFPQPAREPAQPPGSVCNTAATRSALVDALHKPVHFRRRGNKTLKKKNPKLFRASLCHHDPGALRACKNKKLGGCRAERSPSCGGSERLRAGRAAAPEVSPARNGQLVPAPRRHLSGGSGKINK